MLRDREFCSAPHRKSYQERLGRVLNQISEDHAPPPPMADFRTAIPPLKGNSRYTMLTWQYGSDYPLKGISAWPVAVPELTHQQPRSLNSTAAVTAEAEPTPILDLDNEAWVYEAAYPELDLHAAAAPDDAIQPLIEFEQSPPVCNIFSVVSDPEIVARWLERTVSSSCAGLIAPAVPALDGLLSAKLPSRPAPCLDCQPVPPAEPVTAWMMYTGTLADVDFAPALRLGNPLPAMPAALANTPAACIEYLPVPVAEPVATWIASTACTTLLPFTVDVRFPAPLSAIDISDGVLLAERYETPDVCERCLPIPAAEPVAAWIASAGCTAPLPFNVDVRFPAPLSAIDISEGVLLAERYETPDACERYLPIPAAEPVAAWIASASAAVPIASAISLRLPAALDLIHPVELPYAPERTSRAASVEPSAAPVLAAAVTGTPALPSLPALTIAAELEPLPIPDEPIEIPAVCERMMLAPQPEPVWSFLIVVSAAELAASIPQARPTLADYIPRTHVPLARSTARVPQAEPVMAGVWPRIAETPIESIDSPPQFSLPTAAVAPAMPHVLVVAAPVPAPAAEPVETMVVAAHAAVPAASVPAMQLPSIAAVTTTGNNTWLAPAVIAPEAEPVETLLIAAAADAVLADQAVAMLPFELESTRSPAMVITDAPSLTAAAAAQPTSAPGKLAKLQPIACLRIKLPEQNHQRTRPAIPQPGVIALEYHTQPTRSTTFSRPEWKTAHYQPIPPRLALQAALENPEELVKPKTPLPGVFPINQRTPRATRSAVMEHILRVAAAVLIVATMWVGANGLRNARRVNVRQEDTAFATPNRVLTPEAQHAAGKAPGKGPANWVRQTIANRASVQVAEDFQSGMQKWGAAPGTMPANWRRSSDGYVQTGALALFAPTSKYTDYKLEFFAQIENRSLGWVIRAKDEKNYHAMKFTTIENGLRPIIAMVHYSVIDGVAGRKTQIPLNVMVHHNRPFQVAVTVRGKHLVTELDGEEVDTYREDALPVGGVGFFSDAGEHARLYWARVTKNDDWLGHVCAFLSGGESQATAELRPPALPGGAPAPWMPDSDSSILTAAWIGLPSIRRTHSLRRQKPCR
jgi:hypothetical protein